MGRAGPALLSQHLGEHRRRCAAAGAGIQDWSSVPTCWNTRPIRFRCSNRLREAATEDATFIISVPNVAHMAVRLMLLFGYFPKMERGILDRTHLQFFTKDTAVQMLAQGGTRSKINSRHRYSTG